jgi:hypothetical protein
MSDVLKDRIEALKRVTGANAAHLNEALKIIEEQEGVIREWERDMKGTLATQERLRARHKALLVAVRRIADIEDADCQRYVAKADGIAVDTLVNDEIAA